jgi:RNA polymerase sigma-70 factor (ECF subfamily)
LTTAVLPWRLARFASVVRLEKPREPVSRPVAGPRVDEIRGRDHRAWHTLFDREMPAIYRYALSRLGDGAAAEDATSEVFEQAWEHAHTLDDHGLPARAWLFGIARHVVNSHRRHWFRRPPQVALEAFDGGAADAALSSDRLDLARAIEALDPGYGEIISLRFIHGLSLQETATALALSIDAVKGRQARALVALRERLTA